MPRGEPKNFAQRNSSDSSRHRKIQPSKLIFEAGQFSFLKFRGSDPYRVAWRKPPTDLARSHAGSNESNTPAPFAV